MGGLLMKNPTASALYSGFFRKNSRVFLLENTAVYG
jgi:hypothetical protein